MWLQANRSTKKVIIMNMNKVLLITVSKFYADFKGHLLMTAFKKLNMFCFPHVCGTIKGV